MGALSDVHRQHAWRYFSERPPHSWNRGRFLNHCRLSTALNDTEIGNAYRMVLHEIKMGTEKQQAARARELLLEEKRRLHHVDHKQRKQDTLIQVGNFVAGSVQGGALTAGGHTVTQKQTYIGNSPEPEFPELDAISSDSDIPPTEILSNSSSAASQSSNESFRRTNRRTASHTGVATAPSPPVNTHVNAAETNTDEVNAVEPIKAAEVNAVEPIKAAEVNAAEPINAAEAPAPPEVNVRQFNETQDRLRMEILELDVEFWKKRNAKLEERIDELMKTINAMQQKMTGR